MKKFTQLLSLLALMTALTFGITSCEPEHDWHGGDNWHYGGGGNGGYNPGDGGDGGDNGQSSMTAADLATLICGEWYGPMTFYKEMTDGSLVPYSFNADMVFYTNGSQNATGGSGIEVDTDSEGAQQTTKFTWYVDSETLNLYVTFVYDENDKSTYVLDFYATQHGGYIDRDKGEFYGYLIAQDSNNYLVFDFDYVNSNSYVRSAAGTSHTATTTMKTFGQTSSLSDLLTGATLQLPAKR